MENVKLIDIEMINMEKKPIDFAYEILPKEKLSTKLSTISTPYKKGIMLKRTQKTMKEFFESEEIKKLLKS